MAADYSKPTDISKDFREFTPKGKRPTTHITKQKSERPRPEMHREKLSDAIRNGGY